LEQKLILVTEYDRK